MHYETKIYESQPKGFTPQVEVAATYISLKGKLLFLELHSNKTEGGAWGVPAGKLEPGEAPIKAAKRELFEETGIEADENALQSFGQLYIRKPDIDYVYHLFAVNFIDEPTISLSSEHLSYRWVLGDEAKNLPLMKGAGEALDFYLRHASKKSVPALFSMFTSF